MADIFFVLRDLLQDKIGSGSVESMHASVDSSFCIDATSWLLDSRSNHHLTTNVAQVPNSFLYGSSNGILTSNDQKIRITNIGSDALVVIDKCSLHVK